MASVAAITQASAYNAVYSDVGGLQSIRRLSRTDQGAALAEVSKQFESILVNMMLKQMRTATNVLAEGNYLGGNQVGFYQEMLDDQWSVELTKGDGLGFAETFATQLSPDRGANNSAVNNSVAAPIEQALMSARLMPKRSAAAQSTDYIPTLAPIKSFATDTSLAANGDKTDFSSPLDFVQSLYPHAQRAAEKLGVQPETLLAQAALETGWGQHIPNNKDGNQSFNLFGIKADQRWSGDTVQVDTVEFISGKAVKVSAAFRSYHSFDQSFNDYVSFVSEQPRYIKALDHVADESAYINELHKAGYATDPRYAEKIQQILRWGEFRQAVQQTRSAATADKG